MLSPHFCHSIIAHMIALAVAGSVPASFGGFPHGRVVGSRTGGALLVAPQPARESACAGTHLPM